MYCEAFEKESTEVSFTDRPSKASRSNVLISMLQVLRMLCTVYPFLSSILVLESVQARRTLSTKAVLEKHKIVLCVYIYIYTT